MTQKLVAEWNLVAFGDDTLSKEQIWALAAEERRNEDRRDLYLEQTGSGLKINRFIKDGGSVPEREMRERKQVLDLMQQRLTVGSVAWHQAYNTQLTLRIGGDDLEITQGELYDRARKRSEILRTQVEDARRRGSDEEAGRLAAEREGWDIITENADPALGPVTPERQKAIEEAIERNPDVKRDLLRDYDTSQIVATTFQENSALEEAWEGRAKATPTTSFAASVDKPEQGRGPLAETFHTALDRQAIEADSNMEELTLVTPRGGLDFG